MVAAFINHIATATPPHDVHDAFLAFARRMLEADSRRLALFNRMAERSGISSRFSYLQPDNAAATLEEQGFYIPGSFPDTAARMQAYEAFAPVLAADAVEKLLAGRDRSRISHVIVTSCTGF